MSDNITINDPVVTSSARWFWWIAGLSVVNMALFFSGSHINFIVGLGLTTLITGLLATQVPVAVAAGAVVIGFYFWLGREAQRGRQWAFYLGGIVYALDAVVYLLASDWLPVAFHAFVLFQLFRGVTRLREGSAAAAA